MALHLLRTSNKMFLIIAITTICIINVTTASDCDACLDHVCFTRDLVWDQRYKSSGQLAFDRNTNTLYINCQNGSDWPTIAVNTVTKSFHSVSANFYTNGLTVDQSTRDLYLYGSKPGLYKYSPATNETEFMGLTYITCGKFQFKGKLYFSGLLYGFCFYHNIAVSYCYKILENVPVDDFVVDKNDDVYLRSGAKHYRLRNNTNELEYLFTHRFSKIILDANDNVLYVTFDRVTRLTENNEIVDVGGFPSANVYDAVLDRDNNWVYMDLNSANRIYILQRKSGSCDVRFVRNKVVVDYFE